ncbi:kinase-like protein [Hesseltinella vesiculosa]|uniref:dual-specificity kinase n=1 Tax=Hesseltinella vesiculosa TaxID=101127 RepID=A0A1X2G528_9FUNG|nr:kinase-like protein [Hesseltinella vesiculosa]
MVAQHLQQHQDDAFTRDRHARKSQNFELNRTLPYHQRHQQQHRLSEPFLYSNSLNNSSNAPAAGIPLGKSADAILQLYGPCLSAFEKQEIHHSCDDIYFVGPYATKIQGHPFHTGSNNHGYDDDRGDYLVVRQDHLGYRYEILEELGRGSFGQVVKCFDHKTNTSVAIKLIRNKRRFHEQALTEVKILKDLVNWDPEDQHHNVRMTDYFYFRNHLCIVCECLSINLYEFIKKYDYKGFAVSLIKRFALQLLHSLCLLYDHGVIHCDLKPENILLKHPAKSTIKVIDFGSSCFANERVYTYIQSRFYRAPEIILGASYGSAIDMWSFGCILAELYTGIPIFPGESEQEQLACIMEVLGVPNDDFIQRCSRRKLFFDSCNRPRQVTNSRGVQRIAGQKPLPTAIPCKDPLFIDFISSCLQWDPEDRLNPYDALQHEWFTSSSSKSATPAKPLALPSVD